MNFWRNSLVWVKKGSTDKAALLWQSEMKPD
jgi:hypothetical protein